MPEYHYMQINCLYVQRVYTCTVLIQLLFSIEDNHTLVGTGFTGASTTGAVTGTLFRWRYNIKP